VPEELVPLTPVGRLVLNRNPDNFFAETEQVAFCVAHVVPGVDFSNDPLLAGRIHSYVDTQISRLGGPNFHEIPINSPVAQVHNNQRDGMHRQAIHRGRVSYEPNSLGGGCPFQAGKMGFTSFAEKLEPETHKVRGNPEKFADHYTQAKLFFNSQTEVEKTHIANAFRFELSRVQTPAVRERMIAGLRNVDEDLAQKVAEGLGVRKLPEPLPKALRKAVKPEVTRSDALSLTARPGDRSIRGRRVAVIVGGGADGGTVRAIVESLMAQGAVPRIVSSKLGAVMTSDGELEVDSSVEATPSVLYDAVVLAGGDGLAMDGRVIEFAKDQYRHCKTILSLGNSEAVLAKAGIPRALPDGSADPGLVISKDSRAALSDFIKALGQHRHFERESDPPRV
jgi:catalase